jgi:hypothetical protein
MSKNSDSFVSSLKASLSWMAPESETLYKRKLAKWTLTAGQWEAALDKIIEGNIDGKLPSLSIIFAELERQVRNAKNSNLGWASFTLAGIHYAIRIKCEDRTWLIADLIGTDDRGEEKRYQEHAGEPVAKHIPNAAEDYLIIPDNPARPDPSQIPNPAEVKQYMAIIQGNLKKLGVKL